MPISDIPIFSMLRTRMQWHQERQRVLSENVANADTPGFRANDLAPLKFDRKLPAPSPGVALVRTDAAHQASSGPSVRSRCIRKRAQQRRGDSAHRQCR